jgi:hypothetical protein
MLVDVANLIRRRTAQMIVTWGNNGNPRSYSLDEKSICRVSTVQVPLVNYVEVHCLHSSVNPLRVKIGPWVQEIPGDGLFSWKRVLIPVDPIREAFTRRRDFQVVQIDQTTVNVYGLCAWWRLL